MLNFGIPASFIAAQLSSRVFITALFYRIMGDERMRHHDSGTVIEHATFE